MAEVITLQQSDINFGYSEFLPDVVRVRSFPADSAALSGLLGRCRALSLVNAREP